MIRQLILSTGLMCGSLIFTTDEVSAHGGRYVGPGDTVAPGSGPGPGTGGPGGSGGPGTSGPGGPTTPGPGSRGPTTPGAGSTGPAGGGGVSRGGPRSGGRGEKPGRGEGFEQWEFWWENNKDRYLDLQSRIGIGRVQSGGNGLLTGNGRTELSNRSSRPSAAEIEEQLLPVLWSVMAESDANIVDSAVLAMARMTQSDCDSAVTVQSAIRAALASKHASVRQSAVLSLGVLGRRESVPLLIEIMNDSSRGREALGVDIVQSLPRAFAAFSLGLIGEVRSIRSLCRVIETEPDSQIDLRSAAVLALGLFEQGREEIVPFLVLQLKDRKQNRLTRAQIPISLGRLGEAALPALPTLLRELRSKKADIRMRESCVIALGQLGQPEDREVLDQLYDTVLEGRQAQERHFAFIALAEIGGRAAAQDVEIHAEMLNRMSRFLLKQLTQPRHTTHLPWAALSTALLGREFEPATPARITLERKLLEAFEQTNNPSYQAGVAVSLGLLNVSSAGERLYTELNETGESSLKGYLAVALGMLRFEAARETLRTLVLNHREPRLQLQVATALGLMADREAVTLLLAALQNAKTLGVVSSVAKALGLIGDRSVIPQLRALAVDHQATGLARGFACVAIGLIGEKTRLPWNTPLSEHTNYRTSVTALMEILDIL